MPRNRLGQFWDRSRKLAPDLFVQLVGHVPPVVRDRRGRYWLCRVQRVPAEFLGLRRGKEGPPSVSLLVPWQGPFTTLEAARERIDPD